MAEANTAVPDYRNYGTTYQSEKEVVDDLEAFFASIGWSTARQQQLFIDGGHSWGWADLIAHSGTGRDDPGPLGAPLLIEVKHAILTTPYLARAVQQVHGYWLAMPFPAFPVVVAANIACYVPERMLAEHYRTTVWGVGEFMEVAEVGDPMTFDVDSWP